jgi:hypothetical protein
MDEKRQRANEASARWRAKHPKYSTMYAQRTKYEANKRWNQQHPEKIAEYRRRNYHKYAETNRAVAREAGRLARLADPEGTRIKNRKYRRSAIERKIGRPCPQACELCRETFRGKPHADHDHATGKYRGWICRNCNVTLGTARENLELLRSMIEWIKNGGLEEKR